MSVKFTQHRRMGTLGAPGLDTELNIFTEQNAHFGVIRATHWSVHLRNSAIVTVGGKVNSPDVFVSIHQSFF